MSHELRDCQASLQDKGSLRDLWRTKTLIENQAIDIFHPLYEQTRQKDPEWFATKLKKKNQHFKDCVLKSQKK